MEDDLDKVLDALQHARKAEKEVGAGPRNLSTSRTAPSSAGARR